MKNLLLSLFLFFTTLGIAQIGVTAGYNFNDKNVNLSSYSVGVFKNLRQDYRFDLQPYLQMRIYTEERYGENRSKTRSSEIGLGGNINYYLDESKGRSWFIRGSAGLGIMVSNPEAFFKTVKPSGVLGLGTNISEGIALTLEYLLNFVNPIQEDRVDFSRSGIIGLQAQIKLN